MMEYIERRMETKKITLPETYTNVQVGYNNWGHLTMRFFNVDDQNHDTIIVFDRITSMKIIEFIKKLIA